MIFTSKDILAMLPHKAPFIMVDKVTYCIPGEYAEGIKNVTIDQPWFQGHFPTDPILPGVLIVESVAQVTAVMYCAAYMEQIASDEGLTYSKEVMSQKIAEHVGYLVEIKSMKFRKVVHPGDTLNIQVRKKNSLGSLSLIEAKVYVGNDIVADGKLSVSEKNS